MLPKIEFEYDQPVVVHLLHSHGKVIASRFYERWWGDTVHYYFSAQEGVFYLTDTAGALLNARLRSARYHAGQALTITKMKVPNPNAARPVTEYVPQFHPEACRA